MEIVSASKLVSLETKTRNKTTTTTTIAYKLTSMETCHKQQQHVTIAMNSWLNFSVMLYDLMRGQIGSYTYIQI